METTTNRYDEVPYASGPRRVTHPNCLATLARLLGMQPAPVERCRVLELGCATGGNLLPMAETLPDSRFVGIDLSSRQIEAARHVASTVGLANVEFRACSILDVDTAVGAFDYVLCHGVYSWVPEPVRDKILALCRHHLTPHGVAYVSYNTNPGWHRRAAVREMMSYHVRDVHEPAERVAQARALLDFLIDAAPAPDGVWTRILAEERETLGTPERDYYVFHEHLADVNQAFYFHEFIEQASRHELQFLGEAPGALNVTSCPPQVQETLRSVSADLTQLEQYTDFLCNRAFRRTLLVHAGVALNRAPSPDVVFDLHASATARPTTDPRAAEGDDVKYENDDGVAVTARAPLLKTALRVLFECWPERLPFDAVYRRTMDQLGAGAEATQPAQRRATLAAALVQLYLSGLAGLHVHAPTFVREPGNRPQATPLTRWQAQHGVEVASRLHATVKLGALDRAALALLDGTRDHAALVEALKQRVLTGTLSLTDDGRPLTEPATIQRALEREWEASLHRLARSALLVA